MAEKRYLDAEGLKRLIKFINDSHIPFENAIELLYSSNETPGSIQNMISNAIQNIDIADLQQGETVRFYGGSASEVMEAIE